MVKKITRQTHNLMNKRKKTIAVAESCTGGLLAGLLTSLLNASKYFLLGVVAYSNKAKEIILGIPAKTIARYGAVSQPVALLMAKNIRKKIHADFGLSITGIAGPVRSPTAHSATSNGGATPDKSVGTVYIGLAEKNKNICRKFNFSGNRLSIRKKAAQEALRLLCAHLSR